MQGGERFLDIVLRVKVKGSMRYTLFRYQANALIVEVVPSIRMTVMTDAATDVACPPITWSRYLALEIQPISPRCNYRLNGLIALWF